MKTQKLKKKLEKLTKTKRRFISKSKRSNWKIQTYSLLFLPLPCKKL